MSSIMRCRSGLMALSVMRDAPVFGEGCEPLISRQDAPWRYRVGCVVRRGALPRERFSPLALFGHARDFQIAPAFGARAASWVSILPRAACGAKLPLVRVTSVFGGIAKSHVRARYFRK